MTTLAFFNSTGDLGTTTLVYHLAWMYSDLGVPVIAADLDPQANLTRMFLDDKGIETLWQQESSPNTVYRAVKPLLKGTGDVVPPIIETQLPQREPIAGNLGLLPGDMNLSLLEEELSSRWADGLDSQPRAFQLLSAFWRTLQQAAEPIDAALVLIDVGPNLGAINRAALISADRVVIPLAPDLYSLQGLKNLGPVLRRWRAEWKERHKRNPIPDLRLPKGEMKPIGYIAMLQPVRLDRPVYGYERWMNQIPCVYRESVLGRNPKKPITVQDDPLCLARLRSYRTLMPLALEAGKPMFRLKPADGAMGGFVSIVQCCYRDYRALAKRIAKKCGVEIPNFFG